VDTIPEFYAIINIVKRLQKQRSKNMTIQELRQKNIYDLKNILFKAVIIKDKQLEMNVKKVVEEFFNSKAV